MSLLRPLSFALLLGLPATARAQDARLTERLDDATAARVQQVVDSASRAGLPGEPLVQKALEGGTLGASGDRIVTAVQALHGQLRRAREALGRDASDAELTAAAGALRAGLEPGALRRLQSLRAGRPLVVPIAVLTDLVAEGVPPADATRSVLDLARDGKSDDEFVALRRQVQVQRRGSAGEPMGRPALRPAADPPVDQ
ncbi:MAG TPA: hypothetical protein VH764_03000 [Gemmatimonadales bacterium]|jgi:hypothetical protein